MHKYKPRPRVTQGQSKQHQRGRQVGDIQVLPVSVIAFACLSSLVGVKAYHEHRTCLHAATWNTIDHGGLLSSCKVRLGLGRPCGKPGLSGYGGRNHE